MEMKVKFEKLVKIKELFTGVYGRLLISNQVFDQRKRGHIVRLYIRKQNRYAITISSRLQ